MEKIDFNERLAWADIVKKYPHKWVGLSAIDWSGGKILSAVVKYVDDSVDKIFDRQITVGDIETEYTTPDELMRNFNSGLAFFPPPVSIISKKVDNYFLNCLLLLYHFK